MERCRKAYSWDASGNEFPDTGERLQNIYNALFSRYQGTQDPAVVARSQKREFLIDRVLEEYNQLVNGSSALDEKSQAWINKDWPSMPNTCLRHKENLKL